MSKRLTLEEAELILRLGGQVECDRQKHPKIGGDTVRRITLEGGEYVSRSLDGAFRSTKHSLKVLTHDALYFNLRLPENP